MNKTLLAVALMVALTTAYGIAQSSASANPQGSVAGNTQAGSASTTGSRSTGAAAGDLQSRIQRSLKRENLSNIIVNVSGNNIEISGTVPTSKEKGMAKRIAQSFAGNMKVVDRITVSGPSPSVPASGAEPGTPKNVPEQGEKPR